MIMKDFNWEGFKKGEIAVHCPKKHLAEHFLNKCIENEIVILGDNNKYFTYLDNWDKFKENTCYTTFSGFSYCDLDYYKNRCKYKYKIVEWKLNPENKEDIEEIVKFITRKEFAKLADMYELSGYCPSDIGFDDKCIGFFDTYEDCVDCWFQCLQSIQFKGDKEETIQTNDKLEGDNKMELNELKNKLAELEATTSKAINDLKVEIEKKENEIKAEKIEKIWKPKYKETYYFIDSEGRLIDLFREQ